MSTTTEIVLGPPGTGKTTTLLDMVEGELSRGVPPDRIGYVSFTRRAADEAATRAAARFKLQRSDLPYFRTLHSICFWKLGLTRKDVLEGPRLQQFADYAGIRITGRVAEDGTMIGESAGDRALHVGNLARLRRLPLQQVHAESVGRVQGKTVDEYGYHYPQVKNVVDALVSFKAEQGLLDYTDFLEEFVRSDLPTKLEVLFVDEAQDLSPLQWLVIDKLGAGCRRQVVAGDDDQAIYRWAGADVEHLINLVGNVQVLGQSYRVPRAVQAVANTVVAQVVHRRAKQWAARDEQGAVQHVTRPGAVELVHGESTMFLTRNVFMMGDQIEPMLRTAGHLYEVNGHSSLSPKILDAVMHWEQLRAGKAVTAGDARRVYEFMSSGVGVKRGYMTLPGMADEQQVTLQQLVDAGGLLRRDPWYTALDRVPKKDMAYITAIRGHGERLTARPDIRVSTIHGSKGGEADHVVVLTDMAPRTHREMQQLGVEDEARVWYVAATRAKRKLTIVAPRTRLHCPWL